VVVIGVSGAGKSTIGRAVAARLGWAFVDADDLHPPANVAKMRGGHPLDDADRAPWLDAVHRSLAEHRSAGSPVVLACSALKASYRARIAGDLAAVCFVLLTGDPAVIAARMRHRRGHFMPVSLLASQLKDLEAGPAMPTVDVDAPVDEVVDRVIRLVAPGGADHAAMGDG
jgi:carbohydrate kinase (thermoresistant glucokinase family)